MALQPFPGGNVFLPGPFHHGAAAPTFNSSGTQVIDASGEKIAIVGYVRKAGDLSKVHTRMGTVSLNAASQIRTSFQNVLLSSGQGDPDETQDQFRDTAGSAITSNAWFSSGIVSSDGTDTGAKRTVAVGDLLAVVWEYQAFTAADTLTVHGLNGLSNASAQFGRPAHGRIKTGGSWQANVPTEYNPILVLEYSDGSFDTLDGCWPIDNFNAPAFNNGSTPDERGLCFRLPFPATVEGAIVRVDLDAAADLVLYDSGSSALATVSLDENFRFQTSGHNLRALFASPQNLSANTTYRLALKPTSGTNVTFYDWTVTNANYLNNFQGGASWKHTERTDAGAWTDTTTKRPWMSLILSKFDDGAGAAGGIGRLVGGGIVH